MRRITWALGIAATSLVLGCSQDLPESDVSNTATAALGVVQSCIDEGKMCAQSAMAMTDADACSTKVRACVEMLIAGLPKPPGGLDAGVGMPPTTVPPISIPAFDAGVPPGPGAPGLPPLPGNDKVKTCVEGLNTCLKDGSDPMKCASDTRDCIKAAL